MSANPGLPPIMCPSRLVASCAPLLGFVPRNCLVGLVHGLPHRRGPVLIRVDLPEPGQAFFWASSLAASVAGTGGLALEAVAWIEAEDHLPRTHLPSHEPLSLLIDALDDRGIEVAELVSTNGRVWWSHACPDTSCCPPGATALDPEVITEVQAEYVYAGCAPLASREEFARRIERDPERAARVGVALARAPRPRSLERWRSDQVARLSRILVVAEGDGARTALPLGVRSAARLHAGLADVRVRDTLIRRLALSTVACPECRAERVDVLCDALRCAPDGAAAPAATLLALAAWMQGEGCLAGLALERAAAEDPDYRLTHLTRELISRGTDPRDWCASIAGLSEEQCRGGTLLGRSGDVSVWDEDSPGEAMASDHG